MTTSQTKRTRITSVGEYADFVSSFSSVQVFFHGHVIYSLARTSNDIYLRRLPCWTTDKETKKSAITVIDVIRLVQLHLLT